MSSPRSALFELVLARWRSFYREPGVLFWSFGFPIVLAIALGIAFKNRPPERVYVGIETGEGDRVIADALQHSKDVSATTMPPEQARQALVTGKVALVVVPGQPRTYRFDPTRPESRLARALVDADLQRADGRIDAFVAEEQTVSEPGSRYIDFLIPGLVGMGLMQGGLWGVGYVIVEMRTRKLMKRLLATPMRKSDFLLGFVVVRALFLLVELPILTLFATLVFGVPVHGSLPLLLAFAALGSLAFAGLGLLIASRAENIQTASGLINVASIPMFIASGTFFSSARFPPAFQPVVRLLPLTALNDALRAIMLDGAGPGRLLREAAVLAVWGVGSFAIALRIFQVALTGRKLHVPMRPEWSPDAVSKSKGSDSATAGASGGLRAGLAQRKNAMDLITEQRASGSFHLRYEDVAQDGRVRPDALTSSLGVVWRAMVLPEALRNAVRREGIIPILTRLDSEATDATFGIDDPLEVEGGYVLSHVEAADGSIDKLLLDMEVAVHGRLGRTNLPPPSNAGERVLAGRVRAEHVFTRPFAAPAERKVKSLPIDGEAWVPERSRTWSSPLELLDPPAGASASDPEPLDDGVPLVFGLGHTDSNQHVNSLVYARLLEEASLRRFARGGNATTVLPRRFTIGYRRPSFAGETTRLALREFTSGKERGTCGFLHAEGDAEKKPRVCARMTFG